MASAVFEQQLAFGQIAESAIARWLRTRCNASVLPIYEKEIGSGKGPRYFLPQGELIAPDMLVITERGVQWIEAKHKTHFTWYGKTGAWQTGIDQRHYHDYLRLADCSNWPVWLLFLHVEDCPPRRFDTAPERCPTGLFGGDLKYLRVSADHEDSYTGWNGRGYPMVYWNERDLLRLASVAEVLTPIVHPKLREVQP